MLYNTHMIAGLLATESYLVLTGYELKTENIPEICIAMALTLVFSTMPDADQRQSWAGKRFFPLSLILSILGVAHRGLTHSLLFTLVVWYLLTLTPLSDVLVLSAVIAYASHWFIDMFNVTGIQILYPLQMKFKFGTNIDVDGFGEVLFRNICLGLLALITFIWVKPYITDIGIIENLKFFFRFFSI
ncbi:metal-dependent hydrolase [Metabacillus niabensis]|uniref:metal-dependent hydrolase n=1 Tax=Metabacillus niabensis TaxID=324854 RepID=UPI0011A18560